MRSADASVKKQPAFCVSLRSVESAKLNLNKTEREATKTTLHEIEIVSIAKEGNDAVPIRTNNVAGMPE